MLEKLKIKEVSYFLIVYAEIAIFFFVFCHRYYTRYKKRTKSGNNPTHDIESYVRSSWIEFSDLQALTIAVTAWRRGKTKD